VKKDAPTHTAVWALTPGGARLAGQIAGAMPGSTVFLKDTVADTVDRAIPFSRLKDAIQSRFNAFSQHIFIMATGIVVRSIASHLVHKIHDPAVVVCDELGRFAISLVSGHMGGANALAQTVSAITGGQPVITTATDVNHKPAIDLIARRHGLVIENPAAIKTVNMALITGAPIFVHDPFNQVIPHLPAKQVKPFDNLPPDEKQAAAVYVDHICLDLPGQVLILRPGSLVAGMGCNRGTDVGEMRDLLERTFRAAGLCLASLRCLASVDLKADEPGLLALAESLKVKIAFFTRQQLNTVAQVPNPSAMVEKHIGVQSVCEAAALLATQQGRLIVPKQKTANVTLAVAADTCTSSASDPGDRTT